MKKKMAEAFLALAAVSLLTACGGGAKEVDIQALAESLVHDISYEDELAIMDEEEIRYYIDMPDGTKAVMYMGANGTTGEEAGVFEAVDENSAKVLEAGIEAFLNDQESSFEDYIPEAAARIDDAVLEQEGSYVVLCVSDDPEKAEEIIEKALK